MLSLELMGSFPGRRVYVSFRVTRESLFDQIPWLGKLPPGEIEVVDAFNHADHAGDHRPAEHADRLIASPKEAKDVDQFLWLPQAVQSAWSLADSKKPTMIIFDSWDAVLDQYYERTVGTGQAGPSRSEMERFLVARLMKKNLSLVLILERDTSSTLDYLVDGIVETSRRLVEGRLERWLTLLKLRGVAIPDDTYPFTLASGRFTAITPALLRDFAIHPPVDDPHPDEPGLWPGSTDFAAAFGRLEPGRITLLELDSAAPREIPRVILGPMMIQALRGGGRGLLLAAPSIDPEDAFSSVRGMVSAEVLSSRMRVISVIPIPPGAAKSSGMFAPYHWTTEGPSVPVPEDAEFIQGALTTDRPNLVIAYLSAIEAAAEAAGIKVGHGVLSALGAAVFPASPVHVVAVARSGDSLYQVVNPVSESLIKIRYSNGRVFLSGHRPYSHPLILSLEGLTEPYRLMPVL